MAGDARAVVQRTWHVLVQPTRTAQETLNGYSYQILLVPEAMAGA
jgi:hypothetical protein